MRQKNVKTSDVFNRVKAMDEKIVRAILDLRDRVGFVAGRQEELFNAERYGHSWLTQKQAAEFLAMPEEWIIKECDRGNLPCYRLGTDRRFRASDLMLYSEEPRGSLLFKHPLFRPF